jgi:hypothetical protein
MEWGSMESGNGIPSNGIELVLVKETMKAASILKVTPLTVFCNVRPLYPSWMTSM